MNPLTKIKLINELNEREADLGVNDTASWHTVYKNSAWIFVGGFPYELSEGDLICVFSQYGEVVNINLVRDKKTGKSKGFCFLCYEDQRSTILAVDNLNGIKIKGRTIRVDHVKDYRPPKDSDEIDDVTKRLREEGCAPTAPVPISSSSEEDEEVLVVPHKKAKKDKKEKKKKKKKEKKKERDSRSSSPSSSGPPSVTIKQEREDTAYNKYNHKGPNLRHEEDERQRVTDRHDSRRETERDDRRRETDRDGRNKETDDRRWELERDERRREKDRDEKSRALHDKRREADREERRRQSDSDDGRRKRDREDRRRESDSDDDRRYDTGRDERRREGDERRRDRERDRKRDGDRDGRRRERWDELRGEELVRLQRTPHWSGL